LPCVEALPSPFSSLRQPLADLVTDYWVLFAPVLFEQLSLISFLFGSGLSGLGIVLWVDNRYAAYPPDGRIRYGALKNPEAAWIEIKDLTVSPPSGNWV